MTTCLAPASTSGSRRLRTILLSAALAIVPLGVVVAGPAPAAHADASFDQQLLTLLNQDRAAAGLPAVQLSPTVAGIAGNSTYNGCGYPVAGRAADMGARNYFSHTIPNCGNRQVFDMLTAAGSATGRPRTSRGSRATSTPPAPPGSSTTSS